MPPCCPPCTALYSQVPDYYNIVRTPICLKDIRQRLQQASYVGPEEFYRVRAAGVVGGWGGVY